MCLHSWKECHCKANLEIYLEKNIFYKDDYSIINNAKHCSIDLIIPVCLKFIAFFLKYSKQILIEPAVL